MKISDHHVRRVILSAAKDMEAHFRSLAAALLGMTVVLACGTKDAPGPLAPQGDVARVRFVNLINDPARNPVNAVLEKVPFGVNLAYAASTPASLPAPSTANYDAILTGNRALVVKRTADTTVTLATITFTIAKDEDKTIYATGGLGGGVVGSTITTDLNPAALATEVRLRIVNMSPTLGATDVFVTAPGADLSTATPDATSLAYQSPSAYLSKAPATYSVRFVPAGTPAGARNAQVSLTLANTAFAGGTGRTIVAADRQQGGAPLQAFVLADR
jgi:Domain of unknown function (DUF4397)